MNDLAVILISSCQGPISLLSSLSPRSSPQRCVAKDNVCNGEKDCPEGEDEEHCVTLVPYLRLEEDVLG